MALFFEQALLPGGWAGQVRIGFAAGRIANVVPGSTPQLDDDRHAIGLPGLCNLHSHAFQRGMAGLSETRGPEGDNFWTWREVMYRFLARMTPDDVEAVTAMAFMEMLEAGFTRVGEFHYLHNDIDGSAYANPAELAERIAAAAAASGIGLTLLPVFYAHGNFGGAPPNPGQRRFLQTPDGFARLFEASARAIAPLPHANLGLAPHSLRAATIEEIRTLLPLTSGPVHMHIAEQMKEVADCQAFSNARPVEYLLHNLPVDTRWCLIHATHMTPEETAALAHTGAVAGLCPITEANLGDGIFPGPAWAEAGGAYGIGTDSNILIDAAGELRQLEYAQRLHHRARNVMAMQQGASTGRTLFSAALHGGAQALGVQTGLQAGAPGDVVALDGNHPAMLHRNRDLLLDAWVFSGGRTTIASVWANGCAIVQDGQHVARQAIIARYRARLAALMT